MSTAIHMPAFNSTPYNLKENAFTSVNGQSSMSPVSNDPKLSLSGGPWNSVSRPSEISYHSSSNSASPTISSGREDSPLSPGKRKRSDSEENNHITSAGNTKPYSSPYQPVNRELSSRMENPQQRTLPPIDHPEAERRWATEPREVPHNGYQEQQNQEPRSMEPGQGGIHPPLHPPNSANGSTPPRLEGSVPTEMTRAGVQVEIKKRKRQFANRTKTGCGTCRRRKKKCDEAKPECNNCTRGGFICEGYANKVPWPKSGTPKAPPPLQARDRSLADPTAMYARCPVCNQIHIPHCDPPAHQTIYPDSHAANGGDGARNRPINVEEHERKPSAPNAWGNGWSESAPPPSRVSYPPEQPVAQAPPPTQAPPPAHAAQYPKAPNAPVHERPVSHERHVAPQPAPSAPPRQHNPRVYHPTPQTMSQPVSSTPAVAVEPATHHHHQVAQHPRPAPMTAPPSTAPPGPPPAHYAQPPPMHKTEKEKMLAGLPFMPYDRQLADERHLCTGAVNQFNSTTSAAVAIARDERGRHFKTIIAARWIPPRTTERHIGGHLGGNVHVTAPFHCDYGYNISIGDNVVIGPNCQLLDSARICIGRNSKIGARVTISTLKTPTDPKSLKGSNGHEVAQDVWIGENVYIGDGCIIEAGVKIGDGAIVRSGAVVVRDLPRECVAHGNPAFG